MNVYYILTQLKIHILVYTVTTDHGQKYLDTSNFPYPMYIIPPLVERGLHVNNVYCNHHVRQSVCPSVHTFVKDVSAAT